MRQRDPESEDLHAGMHPWLEEAFGKDASNRFDDASRGNIIGIRRHLNAGSSRRTWTEG